ncbi:ABC transporter substrate-binding protein [Halobacteriales archaeon QH_10_67_22]|nr:MAG: ABC transporter substrate-binding protein [Halobacteriales archaeon QH_10_67_22]
MATQRSRRAVLGAVGASLATGGCLGMVAQTGDSGTSPVSALVAGSLKGTFERLNEGLDRRLRVEAHGSVTAARLVASGNRDPDLLALADTDLYDAIVDADWYARFATNALVVAYDATSDGGRRVRAGQRWFDPFVAGEVRLGRTDPDLDPLGYRTLFALELAARRHDRPGLCEAVLGPDQIYPETGLLSRFETGDVDAAVVYRSMAVERDYDYRELHPAVDLSDPDRDEEYRTASHTLADGRTVRGEHVAYGVQARSADAATRAAFDTLVAGDLLRERGFEVPERFPVSEGDVPRGYA